jgi:hypothetical protein
LTILKRWVTIVGLLDFPISTDSFPVRYGVEVIQVMNTLSIRDHGDDNEARVIRQALLEADVPVMDMEYVPVEPEQMYALVSDDAPEYSDVMLAMQDALMDTLELEAMRDWDANWDLVEKVMQAEYEYFNSSAASDDLVESRDEWGNVVISPVIGESALEIGENEAESNQDWTLSHPYTVLAVYSEGVTSLFRHMTLDAAVDGFMDQLGDVMNGDTGHDYFEFINDAYTECAVGWETIRGMVIGFTAEWTDEDYVRWRETGSPAFDPAVLPRGVYLYAADLGDEDEVYEAVIARVRKLDASSMTHAGWMIENLERDDLPDPGTRNHCLTCNTVLDGDFSLRYCEECDPFEDNAVEHSYHVGEHPSQNDPCPNWDGIGPDGTGPDGACATVYRPYCGNCGQVTKDDDAEHGHCYYCHNYKPYEGYEQTSDEPLSRSLTAEEVVEFRAWARANYTPGEPINALWHTIIRDECAMMNAEAEQNECSLCAGTGEVTVICHDGTWITDFACPNCDVYEQAHMSDTFERTPSK